MKLTYLLLALTYALVVLAGASAGGKDASAQQAFSPPTNPRTTPIAPFAMRFQWDRGIDNQWFCVDLAFNEADLLNFRGTWSNWGCGNTGTFLDLYGLQCGSQHFWRVWAQGSTTSGHSAVATFTTESCNFSPPFNPRTSTIASYARRFEWDRGGDNHWFCVDLAFSEADLLNFRGTWSNWGCGTTGTFLDLYALECGSQHFWRVWAQGTVTSGHSSVATFTTEACAFSPPTNLRTETVTGTTVRFRWDRGSDNQWFCLDTALSQEDLQRFQGTWRNHGCGNTTTSLEVLLECGTTYYWRVYAQGTTVAGHSAIAQVSAPACATATATPTATSTP
jgi:hypothetical protein